MRDTLEAEPKIIRIRDDEQNFAAAQPNMADGQNQTVVSRLREYGDKKVKLLYFDLNHVDALGNNEGEHSAQYFTPVGQSALMLNSFYHAVVEKYTEARVAAFYIDHGSKHSKLVPLSEGRKLFSDSIFSNSFFPKNSPKSVPEWLIRLNRLRPPALSQRS